MARRRARKNVAPVAMAAVVPIVVALIPIIAKVGESRLNRFYKANRKTQLKTLRRWSLVVPGAYPVLMNDERANAVVDYLVSDEGKADVREGAQLGAAAARGAADSQQQQGQVQVVHVKTNPRARRNKIDKGPYPFDRKQEQYARYKLDQLEFAAKDAWEAVKASEGWNPEGEAWYRDDLATIRAEIRRRTGNRGRLNPRSNPAGTKKFTFEPKSHRIVGAEYELIVLPDKRFMLKKMKNLWRGGRFDAYLPGKVDFITPEEALNRAIYLNDEVTGIYSRASRGGFVERTGRISGGTAKAADELRGEAGLLEKAAYMAESYRPEIGVFYNPKTRPKHGDTQKATWTGTCAVCFNSIRRKDQIVFRKIGEYDRWIHDECDFKKGRKSRSKRSYKSRKNPRQADVSQYQDILAHLRALQWVFTTTHWTSSGPNYYGDHLLLERLYTGLDKPIDALGERMVAYFGPRSVSPPLINGKMQAIIGEPGEWGHPVGLNQLSWLEQSLQRSIKVAWRTNQDSGNEMSLGIDDFLMSLANERDTAVYLLQQRLGGKAKTNRGRRRRKTRRNPWKEAMREKGQASPCKKCGGEGKISAYSHIRGGVCYACEGTGLWGPDWRSESKPERFTLMGQPVLIFHVKGDMYVAVRKKDFDAYGGTKLLRTSQGFASRKDDVGHAGHIYITQFIKNKDGSVSGVYTDSNTMKWGKTKLVAPIQAPLFEHFREKYGQKFEAFISDDPDRRPPKSLPGEWQRANKIMAKKLTDALNEHYKKNRRRRKN